MVKVGFDRWAFVFDVLDVRHVNTVRQELSYFFGSPYVRRLTGAPKVGSTWLLQTNAAEKYKAEHGVEHPELGPLLARMAAYRAYVAEYYRTHPVEARRLRYTYRRQRFLNGLLARLEPLAGHAISLSKIVDLGFEAAREALSQHDFDQLHHNYMA